MKRLWKSLKRQQLELRDEIVRGGKEEQQLRLNGNTRASCMGTIAPRLSGVMLKLL